MGPYDPTTSTQYGSFKQASSVLRVLGLNAKNCSNYGLTVPSVADRPVITASQRLVRDTLPTEVNGEWVYSWTITQKPFAEAQADARNAVNRAYSKAMQPISSAYPIEEREGWFEQVQAARAVKGGNQNPLVDALRSRTGETADGLSDTIIGLRDQYLAIYGAHTATKRWLIKQINEATTLAELDAIDVNASLGV